MPLSRVLSLRTSKYSGSFADTRDRFVAVGVDEASIFSVGLDPGPLSNADLGVLERADRVWFAGGDQNLLVAALHGPAAEVLRRRQDEGLVIGGTSAGAACMSDPMIAGGTSFSALAPGHNSHAPEFRTLPGLGVFGDGIIDQHFDARGRLGRLVVACLHHDRRPGWGIAEDTALVVDDGKPWSVVGAGDVVSVDVSEATDSVVDGFRRVTGVRLGSRRFQAAEGQPLELLGHEHFQAPLPVSSGAFSDHPTLSEFIARNLMDNDPTGLFEADGGLYARSYLLEGEPPSGFELRFYRDDRSRGWYQDDGYSFEGVRLDILPVRVTMELR